MKDFLIKGYTLNEKRLQQVLQNMQQLEQAVNLIQQSGNSGQLNEAETIGLLEIITNYTQSFILLNQFDSDSLPDKKLNENITYEIEYKEAVKAVAELKKQLIKKKEASGLFGNERDRGFESLLNSVVQTFAGEYLYKSIPACRQAGKSRRHTWYTSLSKITPSPMAINVSAHSYLYGSWKRISTGLKNQVN